jgi:hypothetical protein
VSRKLLTAGLFAVAAGALGGILIGTGGPAAKARRTARCDATLSAAGSEAALAQAIVAAPDGTTICMRSGSYPPVRLRGAAHRAYVTVRPAPGASVSIAGMEVKNSSFLRFEGLRMTAGFNMRDTSAGASHDYQFLGDTFENDVYGIVLYGGSAPIKNVLIEGNSVRNIDFPGTSCRSPGPGYAGGQAVTLYYAEGVTVAHNLFKEVSWHYIQGGGAGPAGVRVEHNLFEGPIQADRVACTHLNVWQIWQGGVNDTFSNNVVLGEAGRPAAITSILFETGSAGATCADSMSGTAISNNLFVDDAAAYSVQVMSTRNLTFTHNTVVGSTYGTLVYKGRACPGGSGYRIAYNVDVQNRGNASRSPDMSLGACQASCTFDHNVSGDASAAGTPGARHSVVYWSPKWRRTSWNPLAQRSPPAGYYAPKGLRFAAGYERGAGGL